MKTLLINSVVFYILTASGASEPQRDKERFQGTWLLVSMQINGIDRYDAGQGMKWIFTGGKLTASGILNGEEKAAPGTFSIDPSKDPKTIDLRFDDKVTYKGAYKFEDGRLKVCYHAGDRPTEFTSRAGSENVLMEFEPEKPR
ncbi:TIGR03067 domain-containing protein [Tautonia plasticadhaerens]|uniref:TIGR03067 domain-containing protein n=1 Tax=Tautonia plasticadhaerens TaxID=2527974 RepID=A0A518H1Y7_9BACT|nr:TIGR03067 domain-containing protein [Tautonia plasticadhaerens]QDV34858.1 hypothetical protein ElP_27550 [Tautonia plasticadhaerens]